jgi:hypothetical protein
MTAMMMFRLIPETRSWDEFFGTRSRDLDRVQHQGSPTLRLATRLLGLGLGKPQYGMYSQPGAVTATYNLVGRSRMGCVAGKHGHNRKRNRR